MADKKPTEETNCPHCGVNIAGAEIPAELQVQFGTTHFLLRVGIIGADDDITTKYYCVDCGGEWPAEAYQPSPEQKELADKHESEIDEAIEKAEMLQRRVATDQISDKIWPTVTLFSNLLDTDLTAIREALLKMTAIEKCRNSNIAIHPSMIIEASRASRLALAIINNLRDELSD